MCAMKTRKLSECNKPSVSYCHGCLSSERALSVLGELVDVFLKICVYPYKITASKIYLCWECLALLKRLNKFKNRVIETQKILQKNKNKINNEINCLSSLKTVIPNDPIEIIHTDEGKLFEVKEEIEINFDDTADFSPDEEDIEKPIEDDLKVPKEDDLHALKEDDLQVPKEEPVKTKTQKLRKTHRKYVRNKHYKFLFENEMDAVKSFTIDFNEVDSWRERDLNSELFAMFKYKCVKCVAGWNTKKKYDDHKKKYHNESGGYSCAVCAWRTGSKPALAAHVRAHGVARRCALCGYSSASASLAQAHLRRHRGAVQCLVCGAQLQSRKAFYKHYKAFHKRFICDHCGKSWKNKDSLETHIRVTMNEVHVKFIHCYAKEKDSRHQRHHSRKYHSTIFECKLCDIRFKLRKSLRYHMKLKHERCSAEEAYCAPCDLQFDTRQLYNRHLTSGAAHAKERKKIPKKKIPCPICNKEYTKNAYMMNHYRHFHMNQSKYHCNLCDTAMLNNTALIRHTKTKHEGVAKEKNKICNECGRGFAEKTTLMNHMRTHSGEKPHECPKCGKRFIQKYAMSIHVRQIHGPGKARENMQK